jgi:hypothetical protein
LALLGRGYLISILDCRQPVLTPEGTASHSSLIYYYLKRCLSAVMKCLHSVPYLVLSFNITFRSNQHVHDVGIPSRRGPVDRCAAVL